MVTFLYKSNLSFENRLRFDESHSASLADISFPSEGSGNYFHVDVDSGKILRF